MKQTLRRSSLAVALATTSVGLTACTGASPTLGKYSDAQIKRCERSITTREYQEATNRAGLAAGIPVIGSEILYKEFEKICKRKGIL